MEKQTKIEPPFHHMGNYLEAMYEISSDNNQRIRESNQRVQEVQDYTRYLNLTATPAPIQGYSLMKLYRK